MIIKIGQAGKLLLKINDMWLVTSNEKIPVPCIKGFDQAEKCRLLEELRKEELINIIATSRKNYVQLTDNGAILSKFLIEVEKIKK